MNTFYIRSLPHANYANTFLQKWTLHLSPFIVYISIHHHITFTLVMMLRTISGLSGLIFYVFDLGNFSQFINKNKRA